MRVSEVRIRFNQVWAWHSISIPGHAYWRQIEVEGCFATLSVNEEEFSHGDTELDENQIGTSIVDCAAHKKQLLTYLKLTGLKLGYLLNSGEALMKDGITRIINGQF